MNLSSQSPQDSELVLYSPAAQGFPGVESAMNPSWDGKRAGGEQEEAPKKQAELAGAVNMEDVGIPGTEGQHRAPRVRGQGSLQLLSALLLIQSIATTLTWARSRHCLQGLSSAKHSIWSGGFFNPLVWKDVRSLDTQASGQLTRPWPSASPFLLSTCPATYVGTEDGVLRRGWREGRVGLARMKTPGLGPSLKTIKKDFFFLKLMEWVLQSCTCSH